MSSSVVLRDYQQEAVEFLLPRKRAFIQAPAGSGKTIIAASAVARRAWAGCRVLWLANTIEQVQQGIAALQRTPGPECSIEICCVASEPDVSKVDILVVDEAHHQPAETWARTIGAAEARGAIVWGFSATPWHEDSERNAKLKSTFQEFFQVTRDRVLASGHLAPGKVYVHDLDQPGQFDADIDARVSAEVIRRCRRFPMVPRFEHERRARWQITQEIIQANEARNSAAVSLIRTESDAAKSVLALVFSIEHGESLAARVPEARVVHSKLGAKKRREIISAFTLRTCRVLFSTSLADEGLDVPCASVLVLVAGGRSAGKLEQRAGRVLRPFAGKETGVIHDFLDRGACFALAQARARWKVYEKLGYSPEIVIY